MEAVNAKASRELRFLQKTVKHLRATVAKDKVAQKAAKEKTGAIASIYVANRYNAWKVATLEFMQTLCSMRLQMSSMLAKGRNAFAVRV